jgi:hypothetical protein
LFQRQAVLGWIKARLAKDTLEGSEAEVVEFAGGAVERGDEFGQGSIVAVCVFNDWQSGLPGW